MFRNRKYYNYVEFGEVQRRLRRYLEGNWNYRKVLVTLFIAAIVFLYICPYIFSWLFNSSASSNGQLKLIDKESCDLHHLTFDWLRSCSIN